jgi:hypothetical protein
MASRAAALARELKNIKSELHFTQERCGLLEEENKRLRDGYDNGLAPEEDDLVLKALGSSPFSISIHPHYRPKYKNNLHLH